MDEWKRVAGESEGETRRWPLKLLYQQILHMYYSTILLHQNILLDIRFCSIVYATIKYMVLYNAPYVRIPYTPYTRPYLVVYINISTYQSFMLDTL